MEEGHHATQVIVTMDVIREEDQEEQSSMTVEIKVVEMVDILVALSLTEILEEEATIPAQLHPEEGHQHIQILPIQVTEEVHAHILVDPEVITEVALDQVPIAVDLDHQAVGLDHPGAVRNQALRADQSQEHLQEVPGLKRIKL